MITIRIQCSMCGRSLTCLDTNGDFEALKRYQREHVRQWLDDPSVQYFCSKKCSNKADRLRKKQ